ncbi:MAG TPA: hypothetical protein VMV69_10505 [Pirellulales bacterium]|nr:hypothetical protein [Pirellulales bacterium]
MKKHPFAFLFAAACLAALLVWIAASRSVAQCGSSTPDDENQQADIPQQVSGAFLTGSSRALPPAPAQALDPAFGPQIDENLARAVHDGDSSLLADTALQLAEGQRVLLRPHKELPTTGVMRMACRLAADRGDKPSLDRLAKAAQTCGDKQLGDEIRAAQKTASDARSPQPALLASVLDMPAETFALYRACLQDIRAARLADDAPLLKALADAVPELPLLSQAQKDCLAGEADPSPAADDELQARRTCAALLHATRSRGALLPRSAQVLNLLARAGTASAQAKRLADKLNAASRCYMDMSAMACH